MREITTQKESMTADTPDAADHFDAIIGLRHATDDNGVQSLDVQMSVPSYPPDLLNPAVFKAHWMAQNWELLTKISGEEYARSMKPAVESADEIDPDVQIVPPPYSRIVSATGTPINSIQGA